MTSHELARWLLRLPDLRVVAGDVDEAGTVTQVTAEVMWTNEQCGYFPTKEGRVSLNGREERVIRLQ